MLYGQKWSDPPLTRIRLNIVSRHNETVALLGARQDSKGHSNVGVCAMTATQVPNDLFSRFRPAKDGRPSKVLNVAVVGGGPAGLLLAWKLLDAGHRVTVLEKRSLYALNQVSDSRSYNLTADGLGLRAFGQLQRLLYCAGTIVIGRAIHSSAGLWNHPYGYRTSDHLVSVPRGDLLALLAATIDGHPNYTPHFDSEVEKVDTKNGKVRFTSGTTPTDLSGFDIIAFADGVRGLGQRSAKDQPGVNSASDTEDTPYLNVTIDSKAVAQAQLALNRIHFFPAQDSLGIGLPNADGTLSVLIEARIHKNHKQELVCPFTSKTPFSFYNKVFTDRAAADQYLNTINPTLCTLVKSVPDDQIVNRPPGHFIEAFVTSWRVGRLGILVGDSGSCAPPWAGFGMNLACAHAADLAAAINTCADVDTALDQYNKKWQKCTGVVRDIIREHGALLNSGIGSERWRQDQALRERREQVLGERSSYQIVAFQERGLEALAGLD